MYLPRQARRITTMITMLCTAHPALADEALTPAADGGILSLLPMMVVFGSIFYFMIVRPQQKLTDEKQKIMDAIQAKDTVLTESGIQGTVEAVDKKFVQLNVCKKTNTTLHIELDKISKIIDRHHD